MMPVAPAIAASLVTALGVASSVATIGSGVLGVMGASQASLAQKAQLDYQARVAPGLTQATCFGATAAVNYIGAQNVVATEPTP